MEAFKYGTRFNRYEVSNPNASPYGATAAEWADASMRNYYWHMDGNVTDCREFAGMWKTAHIADDAEGSLNLYFGGVK